MSDTHQGDPASALRETERVLCEIWADLLDTEVTPEDNFFDLGGYSLLVVDVVSAARTAGITVKAEDLFEHPTAAGLAATVLGGGDGAAAATGSGAAGDVVTTEEAWRTSISTWEPGAPSCLVPIVPEGRGEPFYCVHWGTGNVRLFGEVADSWRAGRPVYGFEAAGYRGRVRPLLSVPAMAERYLAELAELQPHGPYYLGGLCQGSLIAYEMARRLTAAGEQVGLVAAVNPPPQLPLVDPGWGLDELLRFRFASLASRWGIHGPQDVAAGMRAMEPARWYDDDVPADDFYRLQVVWAAGMFAQEHYELLPYDGPVLALAKENTRADIEVHWARAARNMEVSWYDAVETLPILRNPEVARRVAAVLGG